MGAERYVKTTVLTSFNIGGTALCLCSGSGSFMVAAMNLGRSCISVEIDGNLSTIISRFFSRVPV